MNKPMQMMGAHVSDYLNILFIVVIFFGALGTARRLHSSKPLTRKLTVLLLGLVFVLLRVPAHLPRLQFVAPFSWLVAGWIEFVFLLFIAVTVFSLLARQRSRKRERKLVYFLTYLVALYCAIPFIAPPFLKPTLSRIPTLSDCDNICVQSTRFTGGPCAAVSALHRMGIDAGEGEMAIRARSVPVHGTEPDLLASAISAKPQCIAAYRRLDSLDQMKKNLPAIVMLRNSRSIDYVTVFQVTRKDVLIGHPIMGLILIDRATFEKRWTRAAIVITKLEAEGSV